MEERDDQFEELEIEKLYGMSEYEVRTSYLPSTSSLIEFEYKENLYAFSRIRNRLLEVSTDGGGCREVTEEDLGEDYKVITHAMRYIENLLEDFDHEKDVPANRRCFG